ncbi:phospholipase A2 inhibitor and Ly6/PLAUR domain-containing protein-like [Mixophyes fleayi]|uniref:phospholipase A2 inhibitor and Ly6/PLAUR domain-containing protein-like n=1 Tax=Mixophyes fleayi TaxID=3061075 RepID=UPI003F4E0B4C
MKCENGWPYKGYSLTCISCTGVSQTPCTGSAITCPSSANTCSSIYTETRIAAFRETTYTIVRGCGYSSECDQPKRLSNQFMTVDINISCCKDDNCTPTSPKVSTDNAASNGLMCPSCFTVTSAACVKDGNIDCTGNQTKCTSYSMETTGEHSRPIVAMSGCATENLCSNYNGITSTSTTGEIKISIKCNNAKVSTGSQNDTSHSSTVSPYGNSASVSVNRPRIQDKV